MLLRQYSNAAAAKEGTNASSILICLVKEEVDRLVCSSRLFLSQHAWVGRSSLIVPILRLEIRSRE